MVSVLDAVHYHPDVSQRPLTLPKVYYYVRNSLVLNARYFNAVPLRNMLTIGVVLVRVAHRNGFVNALSLVVGRQAPWFYRAIYRGLRGQLGKDYYNE